jgi:hypothetical protein
MHVIDADTNTRRWFEENLGETLGPALPFPDDGFSTQRAKSVAPRRAVASPMIACVHRFEVQVRQSQPHKTRNFYELDKSVLRFYCAHQVCDASGVGRLAQ